MPILAKIAIGSMYYFCCSMFTT